jgi:hypothetical protein
MVAAIHMSRLLTGLHFLEIPIAQRLALAAVGGRVESLSKRERTKARKSLKNAARTHRQLRAVLVALSLPYFFASFSMLFA